MVRVGVLLAAGVVAAWSEAAFAQPRGGEDGLDVLIVTAQRRAESAQDVGVALTAIAGDTLRDQGVTKINRIEEAAPNLDVEPQFGSGAPVFSIRGVGFRDYATNNAPTVGIYVDEVAYPFPVMTQGVLFDVERIEVLRGPQGTLYGRNTTGGAINVVSARPTERLAAGAFAEFGRFGAASFEGYVSGPLSDRVRARLAASVEQGGAWQVNRDTGAELGDKDRVAVRGLLEFAASDDVGFLLNIHGYSDDSDGLGLRLFRPFGANAAHGRRQTSWGASPEFAAAVGIAPEAPPFRDNGGFGASVTAKAALAGAEITYIGAYEHLDREEYNDFDAVAAGIAGVYFVSDIDVLTQEARVASTGDQRLEWIAGLYYSRERLKENYQSDFVDSFGPGFAVRTPYRQETDSIGIFGQVDYDLLERLSLVAGARYEHEDRDLVGLGTFASGFGPLNFANGAIDGALEDRSLTTDEISGKAALELEAAENVLLYAAASRGVKSGGFTAYNTLNPAALTPFNPEILWAYEAGFKSEFAANRVRLNGAVFFYDYREQQVQSAIFDPGTGAVVGRIVNAGKSRIWGAEGELLAKPAPWLTFTQRVGYQNGEYREFDDLDIAATTLAGAAVFVSRAGTDIGQPRVTYQGGVEVAAPLVAGHSVRAAFDYSYRGGYTNPLLGSTYRVPDYWLANARLAVSPDSGPWEAAVFVRNLFDAAYDQQRNFFAGFDVTPVAAPGEPLTFGVQLSLRY
jgi:outer membrane receptor protein involved in Fe transport